MTSQTESQSKTTIHPLVDILEGSEDFVLVADLPGVKADDLDIAVDAGELRLQASTDELTYRRTFSLDGSIDVEGIEAKLELGQLRLTLPKRPESRVRKIRVQ